MVKSPLKQGLEPVPTVYPTEDEFNDPIVFLSSPKIQSLGDKYGMIKIKPPSSWQPPFSIDESTFRFKPRVQQLSELGLLNRVRTTFKDGFLNFMKMKKGMIPKTLFIMLKSKEKMYYYDLFSKINHFISNNLDTIDKRRRQNDGNGRNTVYDEVRYYPEIWKQLNSHYKLSSNSTEILEFYNNYMKEYCIFLAKKYNTKIAGHTYQFNHNPYNDSEDGKLEDNEEEEEEEEEEEWCHVCGEDSDEKHILLCDECNKGYHTYCLTPQLTSVPEGDWFCDDCLVGTGEYGFVTSDISYSLSEFQELNETFRTKYFASLLSKDKEKLHRLSKTYLNSPKDEEEYVDFLEQEFWENLVHNEQSNIKVNYGADIHNLKPGQISGFPMNYPFKEEKKNDFYINHPFNLTKLPFARGSLLNHLNERISGMTIPWLYIGSLFSTFCWHLEDHYMLSANYCHLGDMKKWYCIPESNCHQFEVVMKELAPDLFMRQPDLLHQLVTLLSPADIIKHGVKCYYANQKPGEFIITFPKCYHAGFNCGFNVNEAVNFTNNEWLKFGVNALDDYKLVKKPPVFNQVQLCYSILHHFLNESLIASKESYKLVCADKSIKESDYNLIIMCIAYLEKNAKELTSSISRLQSKFKNFKQETQDINVSENTFDINNIKNLDKFYNDSAAHEASKDEDHDILCSRCQELCSMSWIEVYNKKKIVPPVKQEDSYFSPKKEHSNSFYDMTTSLPTPEPSPEGRKRSANSVFIQRKRKASTSAPEVQIVKENIQHYCINDFVTEFAQKGLKRNRDFKLWIKFGEATIESVVANSKLRLSTLNIRH